MDPAPEPSSGSGLGLFSALLMLWTARRRAEAQSKDTTLACMTDIDTSINACAAYSAPIAPPTSRQVSVASTASSIGAGRRNTYVLIHNVSHSDVVLGINSRDMSMGNGEKIFDKLVEEESAPIVTHNVFTDLNSSCPIVSDRHGEALQYGAGFDLAALQLEVTDLSLLRFRGRDAEKMLDMDTFISHVYFPLLAILIPRWIEDIRAVSANGGSKTILLISGQGQPLDHRAENHDNSTYYLAQIMKRFINRVYADVDVMIVHSGSCNLFRYDENIKFVKSQLAPKIESIREDIVSQHADKWKEHFKLTVSFADGSSARVSAINAAMRQYRPSYMHFWQLKSFWHAAKLCQEDIESHTFEEIATVPPLSVRDAARTLGDQDGSEELVSLVVNEMKSFKMAYESMRRGENDLKSFWLRKTQKLVMAVLLVVKPDGTRRVYKGTNMEVSMPTGSLCAERNVIGTALSDDLSLRRSDLRMIAVLSVSMSDELPTPRIRQVCQPAASSANPSCRNGPIFSFGDTDDTVDVEAVLGPPIGSPERHLVTSDTPPTPSKMLRVYSNLNTPSPSNNDRSSSKAGNASMMPPTIDSLQLPPAVSTLPPGTSGLAFPDIHADLPLPVTLSRNMPSESVPVPSVPHPLKRYNSVVVREGDMNPLKPCGACLEWLRKIAEVNPRFSVLTFVNAECNAIYIEEVETMIY